MNKTLQEQLIEIYNISKKENLNNDIFEEFKNRIFVLFEKKCVEPTDEEKNRHIFLRDKKEFFDFICKDILKEKEYSIYEDINITKIFFKGEKEKYGNKPSYDYKKPGYADEKVFFEEEEEEKNEKGENFQFKIKNSIFDFPLEINIQNFPYILRDLKEAFAFGEYAEYEDKHWEETLEEHFYKISGVYFEIAKYINSYIKDIFVKVSEFNEVQKIIGNYKKYHDKRSFISSISSLEYFSYKYFSNFTCENNFLNIKSQIIDFKPITNVKIYLRRFFLENDVYIFCFDKKGYFLCCDKNIDIFEFLSKNNIDYSWIKKELLNNSKELKKKDFCCSFELTPKTYRKLETYYRRLCELRPKTQEEIVIINDNTTVKSKIYFKVYSQLFEYTKDLYNIYVPSIVDTERIDGKEFYYVI